MRSIDARLEKEKRNKVGCITIRSLESLIRLATAYAKLRQSHEISLIDCSKAFKIFFDAFYGGFEQVDPLFFKGIDDVATDIP